MAGHDEVLIAHSQTPNSSSSEKDFHEEQDNISSERKWLSGKEEQKRERAAIGQARPDHNASLFSHFTCDAEH